MKRAKKCVMRILSEPSESFSGTLWVKTLLVMLGVRSIRENA